MYSIPGSAFYFVNSNFNINDYTKKRRLKYIVQNEMTPLFVTDRKLTSTDVKLSLSMKTKIQDVDFNRTCYCLLINAKPIFRDFEQFSIIIH